MSELKWENDCWVTHASLKYKLWVGETYQTQCTRMLKVASEINLFFHWPKFAKISEFCDHYFSVAWDYIISKLDKAPVVETSQILF